MAQKVDISLPHSARTVIEKVQKQNKQEYFNWFQSFILFLKSRRGSEMGLNVNSLIIQLCFIYLDLYFTNKSGYKS